MMKYSLLPLLLICALLAGCRPDSSKPTADKLVIIHTNDTHSAIDPDRHDRGGIVRRKVLIDSIRAEHPDAVLIDAGDAVQGSLFFTMFGGEVERVLMNELGYDIRILGNHEFDNGMEALAQEWKEIDGARLSTNYDVTATPLAGLFEKSLIREIGGRKIGFIAVNLNPAGMIAPQNYEGLVYVDAIKSANEEAAHLKEKGAEFIVAVTHIGYEEEDEALTDDIDLAAASKDIDIIIGGHTHTVIDHATPEGKAKGTVKNLEGRDVAIFQTGSSGANLGEITVDFTTGEVTSRLIPVDSRLDSRLDSAFLSLITPYRAKVDSLRSKVIGHTPYEYDRKSSEMLNLMSDFVKLRGEQILGKPVDLAIMNRGGIRNSLTEGEITQGEVIDILPFDNRIVVLDIKGSDLLENLGIMAALDGNGVSRGVSVTYDPSTSAINSATLDGKAIDPERTYRLATINYLADGGDYMTPLTRGTRLAESPEVLYDALIECIATGQLDKLLSAPDSTRRMSPF